MYVKDGKIYQVLGGEKMECVLYADIKGTINEISERV